MTKDQVDKLRNKGEFPEHSSHRELVETHISWVILCDQYVYKIKKPIKYSFLDFSTVELRKHFCKRELELNQRFSADIYLEVLPIFNVGGNFTVGGNEGILMDYALKMRKLDPARQMDVLVSENKVSLFDIKNLAKCIAQFHENALRIHKKTVISVQEKFNDLGAEKKFLAEHMGEAYAAIIDHAIAGSDAFLIKNRELLAERLGSGFFRDCHGDLHTRNIFLLPEPQPFDCIEFNDDYREIDVLNEVAFLCMDLDALGRKDLSDAFIEAYNSLFPVIRNSNERALFIYYKSYRANVRAKVNSLRAKSATDDHTRTVALEEVNTYLRLMESYMVLFNKP